MTKVKEVDYAVPTVDDLRACARLPGGDLKYVQNLEDALTTAHVALRSADKGSTSGVSEEECERLREDAQRYRFIRDMQFGVKGAPQPPQDDGDWWGEVLGNTYGEAFTAVVDAAMSAQSDKEER